MKAANIIVNDNCKLIMSNVYNGFDDLIYSIECQIQEIQTEMEEADI